MCLETFIKSIWNHITEILIKLLKFVVGNILPTNFSSVISFYRLSKRKKLVLKIHLRVILNTEIEIIYGF
ncbi:hypothetical protein C476_16957 [Natrinema limicola JCM 13563]|uniref:Uncharacterized protein n=1 Tax=Natrinema limicola JCM 13563 TaxID=1230457 RepID=M0C053_9EURY|nr:hypothetical protein C476_16957 [Natrinema limicola JCM 13563]